MELGKGESLSSAALRSGMSDNTARRYRVGGLPGQRKSPRQYRTRPDPFVAVWPEIEAMLEQAPGLEAVTIFEVLRGRVELSFSDGQLRTLQRRIRRWRASKGPEREVMFAQEHRPGEYGQSDFTSLNELGICLGGERFDHLLYHFVLPYSNWETGRICFSESFEALIGGFQAAIWELGKAPKLHRTDNLSAATHELGDGARAFNERYLGALAHYRWRPTVILRAGATRMATSSKRITASSARRSRRCCCGGAGILQHGPSTKRFCARFWSVAIVVAPASCAKSWSGCTICLCRVWTIFGESACGSACSRRYERRRMSIRWRPV